MRYVLLHAQIHQLVHGDHDVLGPKIVLNLWPKLLCLAFVTCTIVTQHTKSTVTTYGGVYFFGARVYFLAEHETPPISVNYANHGTQKSLMCVGVNLIRPGVAYVGYYFTTNILREFFVSLGDGRVLSSPSSHFN